MTELSFALAASCVLFGVAVPLTTVATKLLLSWRRRRTPEITSYGSTRGYLYVTAPVLLPCVWMLSAALHQSEPGGALGACRDEQPKDPSTNLHGAVIQGLETLRKALDKDKRPLKFGTLVVFTDGTDRAHRVTAEEMQEVMGSEDYADFEIYVIGVGAEIEEGALSDIGRDGTELATDEAKVEEAFTRVADRIDAHAKRFYLLSYCTPSRSGTHTVRIEARASDENGKNTRKGSLEYPFEAEKFGPPPKCDPNRKPDFPLDKNLDPAPDEEEGEGGRAKASGSFRRSPSSPGG